MGEMNSPVLQRILQRVSQGPRPRVVFPESDDERVLAAAARLVADGIAEPVLVGSEGAIQQAASRLNLDLAGMSIIDAQTPEMIEQYSQEFIRIRGDQGKRVNPAVARKMMANTLYIAAMLVKEGNADTFVAGAVNTTGNDRTGDCTQIDHIGRDIAHITMISGDTDSTAVPMPVEKPVHACLQA